MTHISFQLTTHPAHTPAAVGWTPSTVLTALRAKLENEIKNWTKFIDAKGIKPE